MKRQITIRAIVTRRTLRESHGWEYVPVVKREEAFQAENYLDAQKQMAAFLAEDLENIPLKDIEIDWFAVGAVERKAISHRHKPYAYLDDLHLGVTVM